MEYIEDSIINFSQYSESSSRLALHSKISYIRDYGEYGIVMKKTKEEPVSNLERKFYSELPRYTSKHENISIDEINLINSTEVNDLITKRTVRPYKSCSLRENYCKNLEICYSIRNLQNYTNNSNNKANNQFFDDSKEYHYQKDKKFDSEFVYETVQNNAKLNNLLHTLTLTQRRNNDEIWNNYINHLKKKHSRYKVKPTTVESHSKGEFTRNFCKSSFALPNTNEAHHVFLHSNTFNMGVPSDDYDDHHQANPTVSRLTNHYKNDFHCYPMSSQGRLNMLKKREELDSVRNFRNGAIHVEREKCRRKRPKLPLLEDKQIQTSNLRVIIRYCEKCCGTNEQNISRQSCIPKNNSQTSTTSTKVVQVIIKEPSIECVNTIAKESTSTSDNTTEKTQMKTISIKKAKQDGRELDSNIMKKHQKSLMKVEKKLNSLIDTVNKFLEMKNNTTNKSTTTISCKYADISIQAFDPKSGSSNNSVRAKEEHTIYNVTQGTTRSPFTLSELDMNRSQNNCSSNIDQILQEEKEKSDKIKRDIESLLRLQSYAPYYIRVALETPTTDICTEVTSSLSITKISKPTLNEVGCSNDNKNEKSMAMAVNTEPMSLLTLIKMSTDIIKQTLSFMPQIDYYSFLPALQFPQIPRNCVPHYICNICGAVFGQPSQLSDHVQQHNLGNTRDCCICRHTVDHNHFYKCEYCGKLFTRAYCCDLHQRSCARRLGRIHDVPFSHLYLK